MVTGADQRRRLLIYEDNRDAVHESGDNRIGDIFNQIAKAHCTEAKLDHAADQNTCGRQPHQDHLPGGWIRNLQIRSQRRNKRSQQKRQGCLWGGNLYIGSAQQGSENAPQQTGVYT